MLIPRYFIASKENKIDYVEIPKQVEDIVTAFSGFSLKILELANQSYKEFFNIVIPVSCCDLDVP